MIDHIWTIVCSRAVIDKRNNNLSAQNIIEQVKIKADPKPDGVLSIPLDVVTLWARSDVDAAVQGRSRLSLIFPSGENAGSFESEIKTLEHERARDIIHFEQLPIRESGTHYFRIELQIEGEDDWREVAAIPLQIVFEPPEIEEEVETEEVIGIKVS